MTERIIIILFILIVGCTRVCRSQNKSTREVDRIAVKELTENLEHNPQLFLSKVSLDTHGLAHDVDSLGFNYSLESGAYRYNDQIYFWLQIVRLNDSIVSFSANPFYWKIKQIKNGAYN